MREVVSCPRRLAARFRGRSAADGSGGLQMIDWEDVLRAVDGDDGVET
jgi:hypothetical protein